MLALKGKVKQTLTRLIYLVLGKGKVYYINGPKPCLHP